MSAIVADPRGYAPPREDRRPREAGAATGCVSFDEETKALRREGVPLILNPFAAWAVEHAAALRAGLGGEVVAMTMGPPRARDALADTIGTSRTLGLALRREGAVDGEPQAVLAALLDRL